MAKEEDKLISSAIEYLKKRGWGVLVIGVSSISQRESKYNFQLNISFTGKPPKDLIK